MYAVIVHLQCKPGKRDAFWELIQHDATSSLREEPGCLLFHVVQDAKDDHRFTLYEVYLDAEAFEHHKTTAHFDQFVGAIPEMMVEPPTILTGRHLIPAGTDGWSKQEI